MAPDEMKASIRSAMGMFEIEMFFFVGYAAAVAPAADVVCCFVFFQTCGCWRNIGGHCEYRG